MTYLHLTTALLATLAFATPALAADTKPAQTQTQDQQTRPDRKGRFEHMLERMDTNKDGSISKAEFMAVGEARFTKMDRNGDGKLDAADKPEPRNGMEGKSGARQGPPDSVPRSAPASPPPPPPRDDDAPPPHNDDIPPQEMD